MKRRISKAIPRFDVSPSIQQPPNFARVMRIMKWRLIQPIFIPCVHISGDFGKPDLLQKNVFEIRNIQPTPPQ